MIKKNADINDAIFILDNIRDEDMAELQALWGDKWKKKTTENISDTDFLIMYGKDGKSNNIPIAVGGFCEPFEENPSIACVWLLTSKYIKYNKKLFVKEITEQIKEAEKDYFVMYNYIYKSNLQAKKWLKTLGFCFDNPKPENMNLDENFDFFYKINK